jgi:hypothetical protein
MRRPLWYFIPCAAASIYLEVFFLPHSPVLSRGDQTIYLLNAARMVHGQIIYRDFFQFTPPGTELVYSTLFRLFGVHAWIPEAMLVVLGTALAALAVSISAKLMKGPAVLLAGILFLAIPFRASLDGTHHWYSSLAVIAALRVVIDRRDPPRLAFAGVLCGLATCFTQLPGLATVLGIGCFLVWERHRGKIDSLAKSEAWLVGPFLGTIVAGCAYFAWKAGLPRFLFSTVVFGIKFYPALWFNTWRVYMAELPVLHSWRDLPDWTGFLFIVAILPTVYALFFVRYRRIPAATPAEPWDRLMLINLVGLFLLAGVAPAPSYFRLCSVCLPALITLLWLLNQRGVLERVLLTLLWTAGLALAIVMPLRRQCQWRAFLNLPTGKTAFVDAGTYNEFRWISERSRPGDFFFGNLQICFALGLRNPTEIDFLTTTDYTRPEQVADVISGLEENRVRYIVVWDFALDDPGYHQAGDHLGPLISYLGSHYRTVKSLPSGDLVWERNP